MQTSTKGDIEGGAMNARSREKTGLPPKDGDEDLIAPLFRAPWPSRLPSRSRL